MIRRHSAVWLLAAVVVYAVVCSWIGIDFGEHWDEHFNVVRTAVYSVTNGTILPGWYKFPSLLHDLALVAAVPDAVVLKYRGVDSVRAALADRMNTKAFLLRLRRIASTTNALIAVWVFLTLLIWRKDTLEALLGATLVIGSWELHYHSRWVTADPFVAQFGALTLCLAIAAHVRRSAPLLRLSACAAGLACATKYPGGALLVPVLIACVYSERPVRRGIEALALFGATFLVITPGALVEPGRVIEDLSYQLQIYSTGWGAYTVDGPVEHARLLGAYVGLVQMSHFMPLALFTALAAIAGAVILFRTDRPAAWIVSAFPVVYFAYFCTQRVMIVRNVQVLAGFLAVLAAIGITTALRRVTTRTLRMAATIGVVTLLGLNLGWLMVAARSIAVSRPRDFLRDAAAYVDENPQRRVAFSRRVHATLKAFDGKARPLLSPDDPEVDDVMYLSRDIPWQQHLANRRDYTRTWFGPYEVNFNYYPTWQGRERIVLADPRQLRFARERTKP